MTRLPVPFAERRSRLPQAGRIRFGEKIWNEKKAKWQPTTLETFRFSAPRRDDLTILAGLYGGTVKPWQNPKSEDRFELYSEASTIQVKLPPDPLGDGPAYELWGGRGLTRSCDGITCETTIYGSEGADVVQRPCLCRERQRRECRPKLRLSVILPQLPLRGIWRFDTGSDLAADEMPGMVGLILNLQSKGLPSAELRLERRQSQGGAHRFVVPALGLAQSFDELSAIGAGAETGDPTLPSLPVRGAGDLHQGLPAPAHPDRDDIVDAELVEEELSAHDKATALREARRQAKEQGRPLPLSYDDITN